MLSKLAAGIIFFTSMAVFAVFDVWLATDKVVGNTWSEVTRAWSEKAFIIPWVLGVLCGHWFHWFKEGGNTSLTGILVLIGITIPVLIAGVLMGKYINPFPNWVLMVVLQSGILAGALCWRV